MKKLWKLINEYRDAAIEKSWMGSRMPEEFPAIKERYRKAKQKLKEALDELRNSSGDSENGRDST